MHEESGQRIVSLTVDEAGILGPFPEKFEDGTPLNRWHFVTSISVEGVSIASMQFDSVNDSNIEMVRTACQAKVDSARQQYPGEALATSLKKVGFVLWDVQPDFPPLPNAWQPAAN